MELMWGRFDGQTDVFGGDVMQLQPHLHLYAALWICWTTYFQILCPASLSALRATLPEEEELGCDSSRRVSTFTDFQGWDGKPPGLCWRERVWETLAAAAGSHMPTGWTQRGCCRDVATCRLTLATVRKLLNKGQLIMASFYGENLVNYSLQQSH